LYFNEDKLLNLLEKSKLIILALVTLNNVKFVIAVSPKVSLTGISVARIISP